MSVDQPATSGVAPSSRAAERAAVAALTFIQFAHVLDYVLMMPLGPTFLAAFAITPGQFGLLVSAYSFAAGISAIATAPLVDRFARRDLLLVLFAGFVLGTALCGLAPTYGSLLAARVLTGAFGGVLGSTVMATVGDLIPLERRGAAIGLVSSAFPIASVLGIPAGLFLANLGDWHLPFLVLAALCVPVAPVLARVIPRRPPACALAGASRDRALPRLVRLATLPEHRAAYLVAVLVVTSGAIVIPYLSAYVVLNAGFPQDRLALIYLVGGSLTFFSMNLVGRLADRFGRWNVFALAAAVSSATTLWMTHLPASSAPMVLLAMTLFMFGNTSRWVPSSTILNGVPADRDRGGFLAISNALQSLANAAGAALGGWIAGSAADGSLARFGWNGWLSVALVALAVAAAAPVDRRIRERREAGPSGAERVA